MNLDNKLKNSTHLGNFLLLFFALCGMDFEVVVLEAAFMEATILRYWDFKRLEVIELLTKDSLTPPRPRLEAGPPPNMEDAMSSINEGC